VLICLQVGGKRLDLVFEAQPRAGDIIRLPASLLNQEGDDVEVVIESLHPIWNPGEDGALVPTYKAIVKT